MIRPILSVVCMLAVVGCDPAPKSDAGTTGGVGTPDDIAADLDGDGFDTTEDCDDANAAINPGAVERCDGVDNNCDGVVDPDDAEGAVTGYADTDRDGYGDPEARVTACALPDGSVERAGDCDDTDAERNPVADELCDGIDNDCDDLVDDDDTVDPDDASRWYADTDLDTFGDPAAGVWACAAPDGFVADDTDCDDEDDSVNPDAVEVCDDLDNDCDGRVDDADDDIDLSTVRTFFGDADGDGYGVPDVVVEGCSLPEGYSTEPSDCDDTDPRVSPGATEVCDAADVDEDCDGLADDADPTADLSTGVAWYVDADLDGHGDASDPGTAACDDPSDASTTFRTSATDCDDTDATVSPAAAEVCDAADVDEDCDGLADDADPSVDAATTSAWYVDGDGDAYGAGTALDRCDDPSSSTTVYASATGDCADTDAAIHPGAAEVCDGEDNDCDGDVDDDDPSLDLGTASEWHADTDGDGYGNPSVLETACAGPSGAVTDDSDCDDTDAAIHPGATEVCDEGNTDEDCSGTADDADGGLDASTRTDWYEDADSDGYGDAAGTATPLCDDPSGSGTDYVADATDCDDTDPAVSPGADEVCNSTDDDCDGLVDDDDSSLDLATASTWAPDADGDGYGDDSATTEACVAPSGFTATLGDCNDADAAVSPAATEVCDALDTDEDCDGLVEEADDSLDPSTAAGTYFPDTDADGYGDAAASGEVFCDAPLSGYATVDTDCDDGEAAVNPGASEVCNLWDDDCDPSTSSDGMARWESDSGVALDLSAALATGTSSSPASLPVTDDGTLYVCAGTWYLNAEVDGVDVTAIGVDGSAAVVLDGGGRGQVVSILGGATVDAQGFTLQDGNGDDGGALSVVDSVLTGSDLVLLDSSAEYGAALYADNSTVSLSDCTLDGSTAKENGGGAFLEGGASLSLDTCTVSENSGDYGGGIYLWGGASLTVVGSSIEENSATDEHGGGIRCSSGAGVSLTDTDVTDNDASNWGGGIAMSGCDLTVVRGTFSGNTAVYSGAIDSYDDVTLTDVDFDNNSVTQDGGAVYVELGGSETCSISGGSFTNNAAGGRGGAISADLGGSSTVAVDTTDFSGNTPHTVRSSSSYTYGLAASFTCDSSGCF